jgi:hypothetical protein
MYPTEPETDFFGGLPRPPSDREERLPVIFLRSRIPTSTSNSTGVVSNGSELPGGLDRTGASGSHLRYCRIRVQSAVNEVASEQGARSSQAAAAVDGHPLALRHGVHHGSYPSVQLLGRRSGEVGHRQMNFDQPMPVQAVAWIPPPVEGWRKKAAGRQHRTISAKRDAASGGVSLRLLLLHGV